MSKKMIDTLIKIGGSISENGSREQLEILGQTLYDIYINQKKFLIISGGGIFGCRFRVWIGYRFGIHRPLGERCK